MSAFVKKTPSMRPLGDVGMLLNPSVLKSLNSRENPNKNNDFIATPTQQLSLATVPLMTVVKWTTYYIVRHVPKHNIVIIGGNIDTKISKDELIHSVYTNHQIPKEERVNNGLIPTQITQK